MKVWVLCHEDYDQIYISAISSNNDLRFFRSMDEFNQLLNWKTPDLAFLHESILDFDQEQRDDRNERAQQWPPCILVAEKANSEFFQKCLSWHACDFLSLPIYSEVIASKLNCFVGMKKHFQGQRSRYDDLYQLLTPKEKLIFDSFIDSPNNCLSRAELETKLWNKTHVCSKTLEVHLSNMRKKLRARSIKIEKQTQGDFKLLLPALA